MGTLKTDLLTPGVELAETHISWVFLAGHNVWKIKKPVDLGLGFVLGADRADVPKKKTRSEKIPRFLPTKAFAERKSGFQLPEPLLAAANRKKSGR